MAKKNTPAPVAAFVVVDGQQIELDTHKPLEALIEDMIEATQTEYGSHIKIAAKLNALMAFAWYDVEHLEKSDNATALAPIKKQVLDGFKAAGHTNASVPYKRIREYGRNMRAGLAPNGKAFANGDPLPEGEGDTGEGANPAPRSPMVRNIDDLIALYKFNHKLGDKAPAKVQAAQAHIVAALKALSVDVATIK